MLGSKKDNKKVDIAQDKDDATKVVVNFNPRFESRDYWASSATQALRTLSAQLVNEFDVEKRQLIENDIVNTNLFIDICLGKAIKTEQIQQSSYLSFVSALEIDQIIDNQDGRYQFASDIARMKSSLITSIGIFGSNQERMSAFATLEDLKYRLEENVSSWGSDAQASNAANLKIFLRAKEKLSKLITKPIGDTILNAREEAWMFAALYTERVNMVRSVIYNDSNRALSQKDLFDKVEHNSISLHSGIEIKNSQLQQLLATTVMANNVDPEPFKRLCRHGPAIKRLTFAVTFPSEIDSKNTVLPILKDLYLNYRSFKKNNLLSLMSESSLYADIANMMAGQKVYVDDKNAKKILDLLHTLELIAIKRLNAAEEKNPQSSWAPLIAKEEDYLSLIFMSVYLKAYLLSVFSPGFTTPEDRVFCLSVLQGMEEELEKLLKDKKDPKVNEGYERCIVLLDRALYKIRDGENNLFTEDEISSLAYALGTFKVDTMPAYKGANRQFGKLSFALDKIVSISRLNLEV